MTVVVVALSWLHLSGLVDAWSEDVLERAEQAGQQVKFIVEERVAEGDAQRVAPRASLEERKKVWADIVAGDKSIAAMLERTMAHSRTIVEISVAGEDAKVLVSSNPTRVGGRMVHIPEFREWRQEPFSRRLWQVLRKAQDYEFTIPLGVRARPIFLIQVVVSSVLLRDAIQPQITKLTLVSLACLGLSILLAVFLSNVALRPLAQIGESIDRLARGQFSPEPGRAEAEAKEYAVVRSKLNILGQQFRGAQEESSQLRSNIEQLLQRLEEAVLLFGGEGRLIMAGQPAERLLGRSREALVGSSLEEIFPASTPLGAAVQQAVRARQPFKDQLLAVSADANRPANLLASVELLEDPSAGVLVTLRDAETRYQLASQLGVSQRLSAISRLTSGVAHEIKNPLNAIALRIELLRSRLGEQDPAVEGEISIISREIMRLDRVVKTFLDFTRPVELVIEEFDLAAMVREVVSLVTPHARQQKVVVECAVEPQSIRIRGDQDLLKQAILNVVMNGIEAMKEGGRLTIRLREEADARVLTVADDGPGIAAEHRDKVFKLYFTTKEKGTGIGLAMAFRAVQLHNGTIDFESEAGKGSTFRMRFPMGAAAL